VELTKTYQYSLNRVEIPRDRIGDSHVIPCYVGADWATCRDTWNIAGGKANDQRTARSKSIMVSKQFGNRLVLDDVTLRIESGETGGLDGPSGAENPPAWPRCYQRAEYVQQVRFALDLIPFCQNEGHHGCPNRPSSSTLVRNDFSGLQLFPHLTAIQNIMEPRLSVLKLSKSRKLMIAAYEASCRVGLGDRAGGLSTRTFRRAKTASGHCPSDGNGTARACCATRLPAALDPELKGEVLSVLEDLEKTMGLTLILVTHEIGLHVGQPTRVVVLADGRSSNPEPPAR